MFLRYKLSVLLVIVIALLIELPVHAQFGTLVYSDEFNSLSTAWKPLGLAGGTGSLVVEDGALKVTANAGSIYGAYYSTSVAGHFEAEIEFDEDHGVGLALLKDFAGNPSLNDYSMITVMTNGNGVPVIKLTDRQNGTNNVLDNTFKVQPEKFAHLLNGNQYSVPFTKTSKKIKIFRHSQQQFFHFYYSVEKEVDGEIFEDWIEISPSREWGVPNGKYFVGLFSLDATTAFNKVKVSQLPLTDKSDLNTGFAVTRRPYTWSGFTDDALVVTFGDAFPFRADDRKFVFWNLTNNIPVWHLNNGALMSHGFLETWDDQTIVNGAVRVKGCIEPMSDRLLAFVDLEVVEDNAVRKVIKWTYEIVNPDYKYPVFGQTDQRAEATEYYYIYADGSIIRKAEYEHTMHPDFRNWYEVTELIVVAGENQRPGSLFETPSLTIHELGKAPIKHNNTGSPRFENGSERLGAVALTAHVKNAPELFYAFSDDQAVPETNSDLPFSYEVTWHNRNLDFGHWPVNKEPYLESNACVNWSQWPQHVSHASFIGVGVRSDQSWDFTFLRREDGTKYRQFLMLMGMNERGSETTVEDKTNSWLFPGSVVMTNDSSSFKGYSHENKYFEFETTKELPACYFEVSPKTKLINPIVRLQGWGDHEVFVNIDGMPLQRSEYVTFIDSNGDLLLLIVGSSSEMIRIEISSRPIAATAVITGLDSKESVEALPHVYPNPSSQNIVNISFDSVRAVELIVLSITGTEMLRKAFETDLYQLHTDNLPAGSYFLRMKYGNVITTKKIVTR